MTAAYRGGTGVPDESGQQAWMVRVRERSWPLLRQATAEAFDSLPAEYQLLEQVCQPI